MTLGLQWPSGLLNESWPVVLLLVHKWNGTAKNFIAASYQGQLNFNKLCT
jgi:hypothetical protein